MAIEKGFLDIGNYKIKYDCKLGLEIIKPTGLRAKKPKVDSNIVDLLDVIYLKDQSVSEEKISGAKNELYAWLKENCLPD